MPFACAPNTPRDRYAIEFVKGMQESAEDPSHILASACCKHYVANSMEHSTVDGVTRTRHNFDEDIPVQDLIDSYMPPFQVCAASCAQCAAAPARGSRARR